MKNLKKIALGIIIFAGLIPGLVSARQLSPKETIELFVQSGIISRDQASKALSALESANQDDTLVSKEKFCWNFNKNLRVGDRGQDVDALVQALTQEGFIENPNDERAFGEDFNEEVASAIVGFQEKYKDEILRRNGLARGTGYAGPSTRAKLNALYGCGKGRLPTVPARPVGSSQNGDDVYTIQLPSIPPRPPNSYNDNYYRPTTPPTYSQDPQIQTAVGVTLSAEIVSANTDVAGTNYVFGPGGGAQWGYKGGVGNDYLIKLRGTIEGGKTIKAMNLGSGEAWSTSNSSLFPIVVFSNGTQLNTAYGQTLGTYSGSFNLELYAQIEHFPFSGKPLTVYFTDGTSASTQVGSYSTEPVVLDGVNFWQYERGEDKVGRQGVFGPGYGGTGGSEDFKWKVRVALFSGKTVKSITIRDNAPGQFWSTSRSLIDGIEPYPLVLNKLQSEFEPGTQINTVYDVPLDMTGPGFFLMNAYGQPEITPSRGSHLTVEFTDGSKIKSSMPQLPNSTRQVVPSPTSYPTPYPTPYPTVVPTTGSVKVLSPNGGEAWVVGGTYTISFQTPSTNDQVSIYLERYHPAGSSKTGVNSSMLLGQPGAGYQSYSYTVPSSVASWPGLGGEYRVKVCSNYCNASDSSDGNFSIGAGTATVQPITVIAPTSGGVFDPSGQLRLQWTTYGGDFDYYQLMLGNTLANSEVQIDDGYHVSKNQNSYNTFALWSFVNQLVQNSGMTADSIKEAYYVKVNAVKADRVSGGIMNTGKSEIFSIKSSVIGQCTDSDGGKNLYVSGLTDGRVNGLGSYFNDVSVGSNGGQCSGDVCTSVAEGYCENGKVTNYLFMCPTGFSVSGACVTKPTPSATPTPTPNSSSAI